MLGINLFRAAGATGHVFLLKPGKVSDMGLAYSGFIGPKTTVAVVPTTPRVLDFSVSARTKDKQDITVSGDVKVTLKPQDAVSKLDFTVAPRNGSYVSPWDETLRSLVVEQVLLPIHGKAKTLNVEEATQSHKEFEEAVMKTIGGSDSQLASAGISVDSCSIREVIADDEDVAQAIGSKEREAMLAEADKALHDRRIMAAENERAVRTYEASTALKLEGERSKLIKKQSENKQAEAKADAEALKVRLEPLGAVEPGKILGASLLDMAKSGRIGTLAIGPELLAALSQK